VSASNAARVVYAGRGGDQGQRAVARRVGITRQGVRLVELRAMQKIRRAMGLCEGCGAEAPGEGKPCARCVRENAGR